MRKFMSLMVFAIVVTSFTSVTEARLFGRRKATCYRLHPMLQLLLRTLLHTML